MRKGQLIHNREIDEIYYTIIRETRNARAPGSCDAEFALPSSGIASR